MSNIAEFQKPSGIIEISYRQTLIDTIVSLTNAMKADFGNSFKRIFSNDEEIKNYKNRLYTKVKGCEIADLINGYELCIQKNREFVPSIPTIVSFVEEAAKLRKKAEAERMNAERLTALPEATRTVNPLDMLAAAKKVDDGLNRAERLKAHDALINLHRAQGHVRHYPDLSQHLCEHGACNSAGTIAHSMTGGGNFYCATHFRQA